MEKLMLSKAEVGQALGLSPRTIDRLISSGQIATRKIGKRVLVYRSEIDKLTKPSTPRPSLSVGGGEVTPSDGRRPATFSKV
jgi:excisionase family DNA binding protein